LGKYGKKNVIKVDPTAYHIGLLGESGVGKTTIMVEVAEKLVGEDGYMVLNIGQEEGIDAIANAMYEDAPDFETLEDIVDDIVTNKTEDYPRLRLMVMDTLDELFRISEKEVVRLHNKEFPDKRVKSIKAAFGGYQAGEDKAIEIVLDLIKELKSVGVSVWYTGHTKKRTMTDVVTGMEYDMLTTNMTNKYFNAIKTKLHVLGVASIDRDIVQKKSDKKGFDGKTKMVGSINGINRKITFRDDNFNIDSKSRFSEITDHIEFDADAFIDAINDAIKAEFDKQTGKKTISQVKKQQEKEVENKTKEKVAKIQGEKQKLADLEEFESLKHDVSDYIKKCKTLEDKSEQKRLLTPLLTKMKEFGVKSASKIESLEDARVLVDTMIE